jgi:RNA polymerase sigma-70 factor, ECF subfamily
MSVAPDPETVLMLRVKEQGDLSAFEDLVERYKQPIVNLVGRTLGDATEAEDLAQMVFVQVFKSAHRYQPSARFSTWIYTIARNLCLNELRRRSRHPAESLDAPTPESEEQHSPRQLEDQRITSAPDSLLHQELQQKIAEALQSLPENQRTAILLCREQDVSYEEIASVLGITLSATKSLIHRGRETLKQKLKPYLRTGEWLDQSPSSKVEKQL